jgi:hypothetical protein
MFRSILDPSCIRAVARSLVPRLTDIIQAIGRVNGALADVSLEELDDREGGLGLRITKLLRSFPGCCAAPSGCRKQAGFASPQPVVIAQLDRAIQYASGFSIHR